MHPVPWAGNIRFGRADFKQGQLSSFSPMGLAIFFHIHLKKATAKYLSNLRDNNLVFTVCTYFAAPHRLNPVQTVADG